MSSSLSLNYTLQMLLAQDTFLPSCQLILRLCAGAEEGELCVESDAMDPTLIKGRWMYWDSEDWKDAPDNFHVGAMDMNFAVRHLLRLPHAECRLHHFSTRRSPIAFRITGTDKQAASQ